MSEFKLQRYTWDHLDEWYYPDPNGEWLKWEDVEPLLQSYLAINDKLNKIKKAMSDTIHVKTEVEKITPPKWPEGPEIIKETDIK